ncbi:hypothetical protein D3C72_2058770 [compost metagenome]
MHARQLGIAVFLEWARGIDRRVVDDHIDRALGDQPFKVRLQRAGVGKVGQQDLKLVSKLRRHGAAQAIDMPGVVVERDDACARFQQRKRGFHAETARRARVQHAAALQ